MSTRLLFVVATVAGTTLLPIQAWPETGGTAAVTALPSPESGPVEKETIVIRADRAWEEPDSDQVLHFQGNFELLAPEWELRSDEADLFGPLDDPERIVARGNPAVLTIINEDQPVTGEGGSIEYQRDTDILILREDARMTGDSISVKSSEIVYDVGAERLRSSGRDGVEMVLERAKR